MALAVQAKDLKNGVQVNKWIRLTLSLVVALIGFLISQLTVIDWTQYVSTQTAGYIVLAIGVVKSIYNSIAPGSGQNTVATGGTIFTQKATLAQPYIAP